VRSASRQALLQTWRRLFGPLSSLPLPLLLLPLLLTHCVHREPLPTQTAPLTQASNEAPLQMVLPRFPSGERYSLESDRGQVVLLDVWATWCEPCKDALPLYEQLQRQYAKDGLRVYTVNIDEDPSQIQAFLDETKISLPILHDSDAAFAEQTLGVKLMPTSFLLDRKGFIRHIHEGFSEDSLGQYQSEIEALLAEQVNAH
jgi:cytochrome c biogenesis protein CcmG, thiol:disulfide interchange protein DsbE